MSVSVVQLTEVLSVHWLCIPYSMKCSRQKTNVFKIYAGVYFRAKYFPQKLIPCENFNDNNY